MLEPTAVTRTMDDESRKRLDEVYAKWEKRGRGSRSELPHGPRPPVGFSRAPRYSSGPGRQHSYRRRQRRLSPDAILAPLGGFVPSLGVDPSVLHAATVSKCTSHFQCCQKCVPFSRNKLQSHSGGGVGLRDLLLIDKRKFSGFPGRLFPTLSQIFNTDISNAPTDIRSETLQSKRVQDAISFCAGAMADGDPTARLAAVEEQTKRAAGIIGGMSSGISNTLVRIAGVLLFWILGKLFNHVHVQKKHVLMLQQAQNKGVPLVFLPGHRSHMDYIIMTFILFNMGLNIPRIAAGDNLKLPLISWLVTHLGGFFIKRRLDSAAGKDVLYRKCLHEFMVHALHNGDHMEFFIEGSRSRSGKAGSPKAGLLSVLVDTVKEGVVPDILIVPVSIGYDKLLEKGHIRHELMGGSKEPETFWKAVKGGWTMLTTNTGSVRVDFAQPFSLQEYLSTASVCSQSLLEVTNLGRSNSVANLMDQAQRKLITALSHHIVYDFTHCASLMVTNMVAFLLLTKHRQGVTCSELIASYQWLEKQAAARERAVAFTGEAFEAVLYALHYLGPLVQVEDGKACNGLVGGAQLVSPCLRLPEVLELLHHANQVSPVFAIEAVVASTVLSLLGEEELRGRGLESSTAPEVCRDEVIEEASFLCKLLGREFIFAPPCVDLWTALRQAIEQFTNADLLKIPEQLSTAQNRKPRLLIESDEEEEEEEAILQVNSDPTAVQELRFLRSILDPFLEAYWAATTALLQLPDNCMDESEFLQQLQLSLREKAEKGLLENIESCSMDTLRNAVKVLLDMEILVLRDGNVLSVRDPSRVLDVAESITRFKS